MVEGLEGDTCFTFETRLGGARSGVYECLPFWRTHSSSHPPQVKMRNLSLASTSLLRIEDLDEFETVVGATFDVDNDSLVTVSEIPSDTETSFQVWRMHTDVRLASTACCAIGCTDEFETYSLLQSLSPKQLAQLRASRSPFQALSSSRLRSCQRQEPFASYPRVGTSLLG